MRSTSSSHPTDTTEVSLPKSPPGTAAGAGRTLPIDFEHIDEVRGRLAELDGKADGADNCPLTPNPNDDPANRLFALSGGFSAQGSVTESFRNPDGHGWTVTQSSGNTDSLHVFVYCS